MEEEKALEKEVEETLESIFENGEDPDRKLDELLAKLENKG